ncbi:MAG: tetratricopeptide repeat protein [Cytophagales bacterium]|nr:tetratricopeptide repeat protein [Cytophagales bacterium]
MKTFLRYLLLAFVMIPLRAQPRGPEPDNLREQLKHSRADTARVELLLDLGNFYLYKRVASAGDWDSALQLARQAVVLGESLRFYKGQGMGHLLMAKVLRRQGKVQRAREQTEQALTIAKKYDYPVLKGYVYAEFARYYSNAGADVADKIRLNDQALAFFVRAGDRKKQADVLKDQGDLHQLQENYPLALRELQQALLLYRAVGMTDLQGVYDLLGFVSTKVGDYRAGLAYGLLAIKTAHARGDTSIGLCTFYNRLGLTYQALGHFALAQDYFRQSLSIARKYHHVPSIVYLAGNISSVLLHFNQPREALAFLQKIAGKYPPADPESRLILAARLMDVYRSLGQYARAQLYCEQVLQLAGRYGAGSPGLTATYQSVVQYLLSSRQYAKARNYLRISQDLSRQQGAAGTLASTHLLWFRLDSTLRRYPAAIGHYQQYVALRDSLFTQSKNNQIAQLQVQYETEMKDQDLKLKEKNIQLLTQQGNLQAHRLEQAHVIRNGFIAGAFLLVLLLGLGYNRYRLKRQSNQLLQAKQVEINQKNSTLEVVLREKEGLLQEKEWMLKEIHHRVRNNLQIVISLLNSQADDLSDDTALATIKESQHRVQAMALIHQKLYQSERIARVEMCSYINELVAYLRESYPLAGPVRFQLSVELVELDVTLAVPLGLIINEAVTNALKYAFPGDRSGALTLSLHRAAATAYELSIADDGVGLPPGYEPARSRSLGMTLMHGLSEQVDGVLSITSPSGVTIRLVFLDQQLGATFSAADHTYRWHRACATRPAVYGAQPAYASWQ